MTLADAMNRHRLFLLGLIPLVALLYWKIVPGMVMDWYHDQNYSHGFIVPIIAAYFIYERRDDLREAPVEPWNPGLFLIVAGLLQVMVGFLASEYFTMRSSLILLLAGMVLFLFGKQVFKLLLLPIAFLIFMVPIPYIIYDMVAFPLKLFVTKVSVWTLKAIGVVVAREGNIIMFPTTTLEVADACSGIRSLLSLLALAVAYAFFIRTTGVRRWIIIFSAIPIAIFTNAVRVIVTGILAQWWGAKAAEGFFHEFAGMAVFAVAIAMLVGLGALLTRK